jgi:hypothetical protein
MGLWMIKALEVEPAAFAFAAEGAAWGVGFAEAESSAKEGAAKE